MASDDNELTEETIEQLELHDEIYVSDLEQCIQISIPCQTRPLDERIHKGLIFGSLRANPARAWFHKLKLSSPFTIFQQTLHEREEISLSVPSTSGIRQHFHTHFIRKINWSSLTNIFKEWISHPINIAFLLWLIAVAISASMLGLLLLGILNEAFPTKTSRNRWVEINNQILNALFTLMSLYQHPNLFHHVVLLCRWRSEDIVELRKTYCKNGAYRPHEWAHMMMIVILLHITCFSQYILCGLYWGYTRKLRPEFAENILFASGTVAPILAGLYTIYSPLGREFESDSDEELRDVKVSDNARIVSRPEWTGGLFDCRSDTTVGYVSFFCTFCVFGWNMERLGFGNMYVHMVTFFLLCVAPFWIFSISALNISNDVIRDVVGITGLVLCVFGLVYGGFWRIQMRKKFGLPGSSLCCGSASMTDYVQWLFCCACSLAQEVRTVNFYDVEEDSFHRKNMDRDEESGNFLDPLPYYGESSRDNSQKYFELGRNHTFQDEQLSVVEEVASNEPMAPPFQLLMESECSSSDIHINRHQTYSPLMQTEDNFPVSNQTEETKSL